MVLKATEVFTPGAFPTHTYVARSETNLEQSLRDALGTPGQVISISGPSKSGKTVLVEHVVGRDSLITVTGAGIQQPDDLWERVLDWMGTPNSESFSDETVARTSLSAGAEGTVKVPFVGGGTAKGEVGAELGGSSGNEKQHTRKGLAQVVKEIAGSDFVVLVDDFHYMPRPIQGEVAKIMKEAVRQGVKICAAAVTHRGDDVVRANPELRGRVRTIDLKYWSAPELTKIGATGFRELNFELPDTTLERFVRESAGSPQLMQLICLNACFVLNHREKTILEKKYDVNDGILTSIFEQTSANTDFRSLVDVLDDGPRTRGTERKMYAFTDGSKGDVYRCILKAVASDPPRLSFPYAELQARVSRTCRGDAPVGSSVVGTCSHMNKLALEKFPNERAVDWDEQKQIFDIPDPYLAFYLRWSGRLREED